MIVCVELLTMSGCTVLYRGDYGCCSVVFGTLVGGLVLYVRVADDICY